jgi:hypothetical protein
MILRFSSINGKYLHTSVNLNRYLLYSFLAYTIIANKYYIAREYATFVNAMYADMLGGHLEKDTLRQASRHGTGYDYPQGYY